MITYIIGGLVLTVALMGWGLKHQIGENALLKEDVTQAHEIIEAKTWEVEHLTKTLQENQTKKEIVYRDREVVKRVIKEVQVNAEPEDCINQPMPAELVCVFDETKCPELPDTARAADSTNPES